MRKLLLICALIAVAAPAVAVAARRAPGDGTLQVREGTGVIVVHARGGLIGRCGRCEVTIDDPVTGDGSGPIVFGADIWRAVSETSMKYVNRSSRDDMRFRIIGGRYKVIVKGSGIELSVVGRGVVFMQGLFLSLDDGEYRFDDEGFESLPDERTRFVLGGSNANNANAGG